MNAPKAARTQEPAFPSWEGLLQQRDADQARIAKLDRDQLAKAATIARQLQRIAELEAALREMALVARTQIYNSRSTKASLRDALEIIAGRGALAKVRS